jgi:hypothetical protein
MVIVSVLDLALVNGQPFTFNETHIVKLSK